MTADVDWSEQLPEHSVAQVRALLQRAAELDGVAPVSEQAELSLAATGGRHGSHLVALRDGMVVGYATVAGSHGEHPATAEVVVDPPWRNHGIGGDLVAAALAHGGPATRIWARDSAPAQALARRLRLQVVRALWQMRRQASTPPLPLLQVPAELVVRGYAGPADDAELLRVNNAAFDWHPEQGGWTTAEIAARRGAPWFDAAGLFLASAADAPHHLLGFHWTKVHPSNDTEPAVGEVYIVAVDPAAQGRGVGRLLTLAGLHYLQDRGVGEFMLYTEADNVAAIHTYTRLGFWTSRVNTAYACSPCVH